MSEIGSREDAQPAAAGAERCRWEYEPGKRCTRPTAPRRGTRGPAPVYCEQADAPGQPVHNPLNAWRAKTRPTDSAGENPQAGRAPVAEAIRTAGNALDRAEQRAAALREPAEQLAEAMATAADPDAAAAQISAQVADAEEQAGEARAATARERAARLAAEADAKDARQRAEEMAGQAETAQVDAEAARTDASSALTELQDRLIEDGAARRAS